MMVSVHFSSLSLGGNAIFYRQWILAIPGLSVVTLFERTPPVCTSKGMNLFQKSYITIPSPDP